MAVGKLAAAGAVSALLFGVTPASAHCYYHRCNPVVGVLSLPFAIIAGAATIATAPLVIVGDALSGGYAPPPRPYYGYAGYHYAPDAYADYRYPARGHWHYGYASPAYYYGSRARYHYGPGRYYGPRYERY
jgi:hypothetical protein